MTGNHQIQLFQAADGKVELEVSLDQDTAWLSLDQMGDLFARDKSVISRHISNIFKEGELVRGSVVAKNATTAADGKIYQVSYFNLDVIISVGYRVKSQRGVQFRQWATGVLKQHLVEGHTLNQRRLQERGIEFEQVVQLLSRTLANQQLVTEQEQVLPAIAELKQALIAKGEATELFAQLRGDGLASALGTLEQGFGDEWFYPNVASRAAHLLYFVIKNHPLADGNKRTGSFLFLWYLRNNQHLLAKPVEALVNDNTLVALALLVAESKPDQKELIIRLVQQFIVLKAN